MIKKERVKIIIDVLERAYPNAKCSLNYQKPYELLIAGRLSAQCTDARVNVVTKDLFTKFPSLESFAKADINDVEEIIKPCGLYKTKAKNIILMASQLIEKYNGNIPNSIEELTTLSGIGRKTANLIMGDIFYKPSIVTDTHCIRISNRLQLTKNSEPLKVEEDLRKIIPPQLSTKFCHQIVQFGRDYCKARSPKCEICPIRYKFIEITANDIKCKI